MNKILVADVPQMDARYAAALGGCEIEFVRTLAQARQALGGARHDLVVIGVYFDDSRMFDLMRVLRTDPRHAETPILCVRGRPGLAAVSTRTLEDSVKALGAREFIDLVSEEDGERILREAAGRLISSGSPTSGGTP